MISLPVLLLPMGEQMDVPGTGGTPPGPDDMSAGGEVFQGLLQQMLYGAGMQMFPSDSAADIDGGSIEPGTLLSSGYGGSARSGLSLGAPVNGPPGSIGPAEPDVCAQGLVPGARQAEGTVPALAASAAERSAQSPASNLARAGDSGGAPVLPTIPVSQLEGGVPPTRVQNSAPAAMKNEAENTTVRTALRSAQSGVTQSGLDADEGASGVPHALPGATGRFAMQEGAASDAAPREAGMKPLRQVTGGAAASGEQALNTGAGSRDQFLFAAPLAAAGSAASSAGPDRAARAAELFSPLPPETARSVADQVVRGFMVQLSGDRSEVRVTLEPASLGEVVLHVRMEEGKMHAQIDVSQSGVKAALESALPQMRVSLNERGIDVQRLDVSFGGDRSADTSGGGRGERSWRHDFRQNAEAEAFGQYATGRLLGYNTLELVM